MHGHRQHVAKYIYICMCICVLTWEGGRNQTHNDSRATNKNIKQNRDKIYGVNRVLDMEQLIPGAQPCTTLEIVVVYYSRKLVLPLYIRLKKKKTEGYQIFLLVPYNYKKLVLQPPLTYKHKFKEVPKKRLKIRHHSW